jgi:hypothetical protein
MPTDLEHVKCPSVFFVGLIGIKLPLLTKPGIKLGNGLRLMRDRPAQFVSGSPRLSRTRILSKFNFSDHLCKRECWNRPKLPR